MWDCPLCGCRAIAGSVTYCPMCREDRMPTATSGGASNAAAANPLESGYVAAEPAAEVLSEVVPESAAPAPAAEPEPVAAPPAEPAPADPAPVVPAAPEPTPEPVTASGGITLPLPGAANG